MGLLPNGVGAPDVSHIRPSLTVTRRNEVRVVTPNEARAFEMILLGRAVPALKQTVHHALASTFLLKALPLSCFSNCQTER